MNIRDCRVIRHMEDGRPVYRVPVELVLENPVAFRVYDDTDAEVMAEHLRSGQNREVWVKEDGTIIDGHRRLAGLRKLKCPTIDVAIVNEKDGEDAVRALLRSNRTIWE